MAGTTPMIGPDGSIADVPNGDAVRIAVQKGAKIAADMTSPDGKETAVVPLEGVHDAIQKGALLKGSTPGSPMPQVPELDYDTGLGVNENGATGKTIKELGVPAAAGLAAGSTAMPAVQYGAGYGTAAIGAAAKGAIEWIKANPGKAYIAAHLAGELGIHPSKILHLAAKSADAK